MIIPGFEHAQPIDGLIGGVMIGLAALIMLLGVVAASLAAHFGFIDDEVDRPRRRDDEQLTELLVEVRALRAEVARLAGDRPDEVDDEPSLPSGDDSSASGSDPPPP